MCKQKKCKNSPSFRANERIRVHFDMQLDDAMRGNGINLHGGERARLIQPLDELRVAIVRFLSPVYNYNKARELFRESLFASQVRYPTYEVLYLKCADPLTLSWPRADFNAAINGRVDVNE